MLERATGCLEHGGRHFISRSNAATRPRRCLHSTFWSHGAHEIDLPSWWISSLQQPLTPDTKLARSISETAQRCLTAGVRDGNFLDFLYPAKTLALMRKLSLRQSLFSHQRTQSYHISRHLTQIPPPWMMPAHISAPEKSSSDETVDHEEENPYANQDILEEITKTISNISKEGPMGSKEFTTKEFASRLEADHNNLRELWRRFLIDEQAMDEELPREALPSIRSSLVGMGKLSTTLLENYSLRILSLLKDKPETEWDAKDFDFAIRSAIFLRRKKQVSLFYQRALDHYKEHFATPTLLRLSVEYNLWAVIIRALKSYRETAHDESYFWNDLDVSGLGFDVILKKIISILRILRISDEDVLLYKEFACKLLETFYNSHQEGSGAQEIPLRVVLRLLNLSTNGEAPTKFQCQALISRLLSLRAPQQVASDYVNEALGIYHFMREEKISILDGDILQRLCVRLSDHHNRDLRTVFEDLRMHNGTPSVDLYRRVLHEFARQGDLTAFYGYLDEMQDCYGKITSPLPLLSLIQHHAQHGEVKKLIEVFNSIQSKFQITPNRECWNAVISALARTEDIAEALKWATAMADNGHEPDAKTFLPFLKYYCSRGDLESAEKVMDEIRSRGLQIDAKLVATVVYGHTQAGDLEKAKEIAQESAQMELRGNVTEIWNVILVAYALRGYVDEVNKIRKEMQERTIPQDEWTYAALMTSLCTTGFPFLAFKILKALDNDAWLKVHPFHFPIILGGFMKTKQYNQIFEVIKWMLNNNFKPDWVAKTIMVKAAAKLDIWYHRTRGLPDDELTLSRAEELLKFTLNAANPRDLVISRPLKGVGFQPIQEAYSSNYFEFLIFIYGHMGAYEKVTALYDAYTKFASNHRPDQPVSPPTKMLSALMIHHRREQNWDEVERCWQLALSKADPLARKANKPDGEADWVLESRKYILSLPLIHYMKALVEQERTEELEPLIASLQKSGFDLDSRAWNLYIQTLALSGRHHEAFQKAEKLLMPGWRGWPSSKLPVKRILAAQRPQSFEAGRRVPIYETMVILTRSYMEVKMRTAPSEVEKRVAELKKTAPNVIRAVLDMPSINDKYQAKYLKGYKAG